mgnify:CR=1 FL=1
MICILFLFQAEDGIRDLVRSRGLGDVYKRQGKYTYYVVAEDYLAVLSDTFFFEIKVIEESGDYDLSLIHI